MSVTSECSTGDLIYVIEGFVAHTVFDCDGNLDLENSIELAVGDTVIYQDWFYNKIDDNILIEIKYKPSNKDECWSAVESYFVTEDVWNGLKEFFLLEKEQ
ncbi:hypothetical protein [Paenibacillus sp. CGMCC 1.18879]|uniref:hypothetical protein n=1 Tax=Paenibacillus sp. CGMCC 1.18879 TaxID=2834466 RepID=UPI001CA8EB11|nr:hypothetical protein [Paenibacillus sp. CGMCC 1.18879]MBY9079732.1 hypothetical protein [Paenibacillus sp. CGMCC 1.18879]